MGTALFFITTSAAKKFAGTTIEENKKRRRNVEEFPAVIVIIIINISGKQSLTTIAVNNINSKRYDIHYPYFYIISKCYLDILFRKIILLRKL